MTLAVLRLAALDTQLVKEFDCEGLELEWYTTVESFLHSFSYPYTLEICPTVAAGLHRSDYGVDTTKLSNTEWDTQGPADRVEVSVSENGEGASADPPERALSLFDEDLEAYVAAARASGDRPDTNDRTKERLAGLGYKV